MLLEMCDMFSIMDPLEQTVFLLPKMFKDSDFATQDCIGTVFLLPKRV